MTVLAPTMHAASSPAPATTSKPAASEAGLAPATPPVSLYALSFQTSAGPPAPGTEVIPAWVGSLVRAGQLAGFDHDMPLLVAFVVQSLASTLRQHGSDSVKGES